MKPVISISTLMAAKSRTFTILAVLSIVALSLPVSQFPALASRQESQKKFYEDPGVPVEYQEIFVDIQHPNCDDQNPGTEELPLCSIQAAADRAVPATMVFVKAGVYQEMVQVRNSGASQEAMIKFIAYEDEHVVIDTPADACFDLRNVEYIKIHGFELRGAWIAENRSSVVDHQDDIEPGHAGGIRAFPLNETGFGVRNSAFTYNVIHDNDAGIHIVLSDNNLISNNVIFDSGEAPIRIKRGHYNEISNNLTFDNGTSGQRWGITFYCANGTQVYHNTVVEPGGGAFYIYEGTSNLGGTPPGDPGFCVPSSPSNIFDNIGMVGGVSSFAAPLVIGSSTTTDRDPRLTLLYGELDNHYHHDLWYNLNNPEELVSWGDHGENLIFPFYALLNLEQFQQKHEGYGEATIAADPLFVNPSRWDFRLSEGSPGIGTASDGTDRGVNFDTLPPYQRYAVYQRLLFMPVSLIIPNLNIYRR